MTTDLQALIQHLRGGDWNLRSPQEMADMIADKLEAALAAAPSTSPAAAAQTVEVPEGLARSDAEFWLRNRSKIISAIADEGYTLMSNALGFSLMKLGKVTAQSAPAAAAVAGEPVAIEAHPVEGEKPLSRVLDEFLFDHPTPSEADFRSLISKHPKWAGDIAEFAGTWFSVAHAPAAPHPSPSAAEQAGRWQPIETAPKNGYMLVHEDGAIRALLRIDGVWHKPGYPAIVTPTWGDVLVGDDAKRALPAGYRLELCDGCCENPTHWMPLPAAPSASPAEAPAEQVNVETLTADGAYWPNPMPTDLTTSCRVIVRMSENEAPHGASDGWWDGYRECAGDVRSALLRAAQYAAAHPQPVAPAGQAAAGVQGEDAFLDSPFNACMYREQCKALIRPAPAVERGVAEGIITEFCAKWSADDLVRADEVLDWLGAALSTAGKEQA